MQYKIYCLPEKVATWQHKGMAIDDDDEEDVDLLYAISVIASGLSQMKWMAKGSKSFARFLSSFCVISFVRYN